MSWFTKPKQAVCAECKVYFLPDDTDFGDTHCAIHRKPLQDRLNRQTRVARWAELHWERLEAQCIQEDRANIESKHAVLMARACHFQNDPFNGITP